MLVSLLPFPFQNPLCKCFEKWVREFDEVRSRFQAFVEVTTYLGESSPFFKFRESDWKLSYFGVGSGPGELLWNENLCIPEPLVALV